jgi:glycosyltransferase involved in cell wall biosynthesis
VSFWLLDDGRTYGGGQMTALRLARHLAPESRILCPSSSELAARCRDSDVPTDHAEFPGPSLRSLAALRSLRRRLAEADDHVVVVGGSLRAQVYAHVARTGLRHRPPIVQLMHERDSADRRLGVLLLRRFGAVAAVGGNSADAYRLALEQPVVALNNVLLPEELESPPPRDSSGRAPVLAVLARMIPEKGVVELLDELAAIPDSWSRLVVAGRADGADYAGAVEKRAVAGSISVLGHVDNVRGLLAEVDVVVVPSTGHEGQPGVILEALACDRPVIVREQVWSDDYAGLPVEPYRTAADLARILGTITSAPVDRNELARRFGPAQAVAALEQAAGRG